MSPHKEIHLETEICADLRAAGWLHEAGDNAGYDRALDTIIDSNITTLIVGLALLIWGSGPVRGFAVVHCLGIVTSVFSAVMVSRGLVNLIYGGKKKVAKLSIGNVNWHKSAIQSPVKA